MKYCYSSASRSTTHTHTHLHTHTVAHTHTKPDSVQIGEQPHAASIVALMAAASKYCHFHSDSSRIRADSALPLPLTGSVHVTGMGKSYCVAARFAASLSSIGTSSLAYITMICNSASVMATRCRVLTGQVWRLRRCMQQSGCMDRWGPCVPATLLSSCHTVAPPARRCRPPKRLRRPGRRSWLWWAGPGLRWPKPVDMLSRMTVLRFVVPHLACLGPHIDMPCLLNHSGLHQRT